MKQNQNDCWKNKQTNYRKTKHVQNALCKPAGHFHKLSFFLEKAAIAGIQTGSQTGQ